MFLLYSLTTNNLVYMYMYGTSNREQKLSLLTTNGQTFRAIAFLRGGGERNIYQNVELLLIQIYW